MSPTPSERVFRHCSRSAAYDGLFLSTPCSHQGGPVQLGSWGYYQISAGPTAVRANCSTCLFTSDVTAHDSIASGAALVTHPGVNPFPVCVLAYHYVHGTAPRRIWLTSEVAARRRLRSVDSVTMLVPSTCRSALGDIAAARACNGLPSQTMAASSLLTMRRSLLFRQSLG